MIKKWWKQKWVILMAGVVLVAGTIMVSSQGGDESQYELAEAAFVDITQEVSVTGTIESDTKINLHFQKPGQIQSVLVDVGDFVAKGQVLARLDTTALAINVQSVEANLALARANYNKSLAGSTDEAIQVARAGLEKSQADLSQALKKFENITALTEERVKSAELTYESAVIDFDNAVAIYGDDLVSSYEDMNNAMEDALKEADDSLRQVDTIIGVDNEDVSADYETALSARNSSDYKGAQAAFRRAKISYDEHNASLIALSSDDYEALDALSVEVKIFVGDVDDLVGTVDWLLEDSPTIGAFNSTVRNTLRTTMATEAANLADALTAVSNATQAVTSAMTSETTQVSGSRSTLAEAAQALSQSRVQAKADVDDVSTSVSVFEALVSQKEASLAEVAAGPRNVDLASLRAAISESEAAYRLAQYNLSLGSVVAPMPGIVTRIVLDEGENVNTTDDFIELLSRDFQVIANVSESDIAKVNLGDPVSMTLDAFYYDKVFEAEIVEIDPAETVVQGVIYYQITAGFTTEDTQVKPGMTANMDIVTEETTNVLAVPIRAVKYDGARSYVLQPDSIVSGTTKEVDIEVGLRGDQFIEVVSGLEEGDDVVTYVR
jgi:RND family efflux transporter MFP subunit